MSAALFASVEFVLRYEWKAIAVPVSVYANLVAESIEFSLFLRIVLH